jgi:hypothetical protein
MIDSKAIGQALIALVALGFLGGLVLTVAFWIIFG